MKTTEPESLLFRTLYFHLHAVLEQPKDYVSILLFTSVSY